MPRLPSDLHRDLRVLFRQLGVIDDGYAIMAIVDSVGVGSTTAAAAAKAISSQSLIQMGITRRALSEALRSVDLHVDEGDHGDSSGVVVMGDVIKGIKISGSTIYGSVVAADTISDSMNRVEAADLPADTKKALESLHGAIGQLVAEIPEEQALQASRDLDAFTQEALSPEPRKKMLEVTGDGLIQAAKFVAAIAPTVVTLVGAITKAY